MNDDKNNEGLIKAIQEAADGKKITPLSNQTIGQDTIDALELISRIKQSFSQASPSKHNFIKLSNGDQWGHLRIEDKIGEGGMGTVYSAFDSTLKRSVAVKFLNQRTSAYISAQQFIDEACRMAKVRHPNVLAVYGAQTEAQVTGFWAELLEGENLEQYAKKTIEFPQVLVFASQLSSALCAIHDKHIIHADIKPQNVTIDAERGAILMDFGAGTDLNINQEHIKTPSFTPMAMAPELHQGQPASTASDVYALGILFFYISAGGQYPFKANSLADLKNKVQSSKAIDTSDLAGSRKWHRLIQSMLSISPQNRPTAAQALKTLKQIIEAPAKRNKKIATYSLAIFLLSITVISLFSYYTLKSAKQETDAALKETSEMNQLMGDILYSASPTEYGKDVLMVDVLNNLTTVIKDSKNIRSDTKAKALANLSVSLNNLGDTKQGLKLIDESLAMMSGANYLLNVNTLLSKANLLLSNGDMNNSLNTLDDIQLILNQAEQIIESRQLSDNETNAKFNYLKGLLLYKLKKPKLAKESYITAMNFWKNEPASENSEIQLAIIHNSMSTMLSSTNDLKQSIYHAEQAYKLFKKHSKGHYNSNLFVALSNLSVGLAKSGDIERALPVFRELYEQNQELLGRKHENTLLSANNLATAYNQNNEFEKALSLIQTLQSDLDSFPTDGRIYIMVTSTHARTLQGLKQYEKSIRKYQQMIKTIESNWGTAHEMVFINQFNLAELYNESGQPQRAKSLLKNRLPSAENQLSINHPASIEMKEALAWSYHLLNENRVESIKMLEEVIELKLKIYGPTDKLTVQTINRLDEINKQSH
ncbi:protein kinase [Marinicella sp. W31]|uniref:serine/threonine-protein kinase n=1 Tax=Marinicella sp. W31 TaxID=3023713 RepID=UPI0037565949